jgi:hypothetical protein
LVVEISERELRRMVAGIDDQHRAAMATFREDNRELIFETGPSRRKFLAGLGLGSAALVVGSAVLPMAPATATSPRSPPASSTPPWPPTRPRPRAAR